MKFNKEKFKFNIDSNIIRFLSPKRKNVKRYIYIAGSLIFIYVYILGDYGIYQLLINKSEEKKLKKEIEYLLSEQKRLEIEKELVAKSDLKEVEKIAREKYGLTKPGEKVFQIVIEDED